MTEEELERFVRALDRSILGWRQSLPEEERDSAETERRIRVLRFVGLDAVAKASGGNPRFLKLAEQAEKEMRAAHED